MAFFKSKKGKPNELVKNTRQLLLGLKKGGPKNVEDIGKYLQQIKAAFDGDLEHELPLIDEIFSQELIPLLITNLGRLDFEAKKDTAAIFSMLLKRCNERAPSSIDYLLANPQVIVQMVSGCSDKDTALHFGVMLRECIRFEPLTKILLQDENFYFFFSLIENPNFDIASDSFTTFKELLTKHKPIIAEYLEKNYDKFFDEHYSKLLHSTNYVTKRQSLKLLGELLLDRSNFNVMTRYISQRSNLKLMMTLLRDKSRSIQFEAFHVFKVFVANPNKPEPILEILVKNKDGLIAYLREFHNDKDDEQFTDEKGYLVKQIEAL